MKKLSVLICLLFSTLAMNAQQTITGIWNTGKENTNVEITEVNSVCEGVIVSSDNTKAKIGKQLLKDIKLVDGEWKGKLFAAKKGEWMDAVLEEKGNKLLITVKAGWKSKTLEWTRE